MKNFLFFIIISVFGTGCASTQQPTALNQLQIQVAQLEHELQKNDQEMDDLKYQVDELSRQMGNSEQGSAGIKTPAAATGTDAADRPVNAEKDERIIRVAVTPEDVQLALKNAGYYTGNIDGKIGAQTKKAIAQFQKEHGLKDDGIVGEKTWSQLQGYLAEPTEPTSSF